MSSWNSQHSFKVWRFVKKVSELGQVSVAWKKTSRQPTESVNRTPTQTTCKDTHSVSQHILNRLTTFQHGNKRGWTAGKHRIAHLCVPIKVSSTCRVFPCRTWHWPQAQVLSHLPHLSFRQSHQHTQDLWYTIHIDPAKFHGREAGQLKSHLWHAVTTDVRE